MYGVSVTLEQVEAGDDGVDVFLQGAELSRRISCFSDLAL